MTAELHAEPDEELTSAAAESALQELSGTTEERRTLRDMAKTKYGLTPALVLFALYFFDEFDSGAFNVLAPDVQRAFRLSDQAYGRLVIVNVAVVLLLAIPVGYLGDRLRRVPLVVASAIVAGVFSFATGLATTVLFLVLVRIGNGVGRLVNEPVHSALLSDYYKPADRPLAFSLHRNAVYAGAIVGSLGAGGVASVWGWRAAFLVLIVPIVATASYAVRLREPQRGESEDAVSAAVAGDEPPITFSEARRTLFGVATLRRFYGAQVFFGAALVPLGIYLPLFLDKVFHVGVGTRGVLVAVNNFATLLGLALGGYLLPRWMKGDPGRAMGRAALCAGGCGVVLFFFALAPTLPVAIGVILIGYFLVGLLLPALATVQSLVSPARARSLSFSLGAIYSLGGAAAFFFSPLGAISDDHGLRAGIIATTPFWIIGALRLRKASSFVASDIATGIASLARLAEQHEARAAGGDHLLLSCRGVDVAYGDVQVLFGVDLDVAEGELVALLGTNGAGKSTILKAISGLLEPRAGTIALDGQDITYADPLTRIRQGVVQMPGGRSVFPTLTVRECLRLAGWARKDDPDGVAAATREALDTFPRVEERLDQLAGNLSGGEQQQLGLAMALISKPRLLMIDELSLGLSPVVVGLLCDVVRQINAAGTTVIIVEQSVNVALTLAERAVFMEKGEVRFSGSTAELLERDDVLRSVYLQGTAAALGDANTQDAQRAATQTVSGPALQVRDLSVRFGGIQAVKEVTFDVAPGEILGVIGPNGAGKTTVFDLVSGFLTPTGGQVLLDGVDVTRWSAARRFAAGLGRSFQDARIFPSLTVAENIAVALERSNEVRDPVSAMFALPAMADAEEAVAYRVHELIELLGLDAFRNKFAGELSTGSRRIVDLAMVVAHGPSVLLLDEPSSGIAQREAEALAPALLAVRAQLGCAIVVIEHDMPLIRAVSDRLLALDTGEVVVTGSAEDVIEHPRVVASYLGDNEAALQRSGAAG